MSIGAGRIAIGGLFLAAPVTAVRLLGLDTATAARVTWLARMTAARDGVIGAGTLVSSAGAANASSWLLAGSASDAVDAAVLIAALRAGEVRGWQARAITGGAIAAALAAAAAALDMRLRARAAEGTTGVQTSRRSWRLSESGPRSP